MLLLRIFWIFTRVALLSWGGGPASLALMQRSVVDEGWASSPEFADADAVGNALPGPIAPQVSAFVGYKLAGLPGALAAVAGTIGPTTILMLIMVIAFVQIKDAPAIKAMLTAMRPVVVGLLLWTAYDLGRGVFWKQGSTLGALLAQQWDKLLIVLVTFALLTFTRVNPAFIVLGAAILGFLVYR